jgi:DNA-binding NtrC family response regulator
LIHLPPLRERGNDVLLLAKSFADKFCEANHLPTKQFTREAAESLLSYDWPGNIRELKSTIERAVIISDESKIEETDLIYSANVF